MNQNIAGYSADVQGFTLVEVIAVVVLMSILSVLGTTFIVSATESYQHTESRSKLANTGRQAIERMSRQLRGSLPYSVRLTNSNACIEFLPIASGGNYVDAVPDAVNGIAASATIAVSPHNIEFGVARYVSIGAMGSGELYGASTVSLASLASRSSIQLNLSATKSWQRNSINQRFYIIDSPQAFCVVGSELRFYDNQSIVTEVNLASTYSLLANSVSSLTPFGLTAASDNRNVNVLIALSFASNGESIALNHSVMIRNVP
jgi:MSHA biogenesis protein MshO